MCLFQYEDDPEPEEPTPAGLLYVPVRPGTGGGAGTVIRLFRTPLGVRTAVGFTCPERLAATLGEGQAYIRLSESLLRELCGPLGAELITVDPTLSAPAATATTHRPDRFPVRAA
ncbi:SAV_915 family protein [Streptomyces sp. NPDC097617]|uniref:SAV_915 family protein n=1 Tax=Streptomyces sp. NPDC097617 TaxID=3366091 RepID=UPI003817DE3B